MVVQPHAGFDVELDVVGEKIGKPAIEEVLRLGAGVVGPVREKGVPLGIGSPAIGQREGDRGRLCKLGLVLARIVAGPISLRASRHGDVVG